MRRPKTAQDAPGGVSSLKTPRTRKSVATGQDGGVKPHPGVRMWAVMKAHAWDSMICNGWPVACPPAGPHRFIPVFDTRAEAVAWAGSERLVVELETL